MWRQTSFIRYGFVYIAIYQCMRNTYNNYVVTTSKFHGVCQIVGQEYGYEMEYGILCTASNAIFTLFSCFFRPLPFCRSPVEFQVSLLAAHRALTLKLIIELMFFWPFEEAGQYKAQTWLWVGWYVLTSRVTGIAMKSCYRSIFKKFHCSFCSPFRHFPV